MECQTCKFWIAPDQLPPLLAGQTRHEGFGACWGISNRVNGHDTALIVAASDDEFDLMTKPNHFCAMHEVANG